MLALFALLVAIATIYDYTNGFSSSVLSTVKHSKEDRPDMTSKLTREIFELNYFIAHKSAINERYQAIAVPYSESIATFVSLYAPGNLSNTDIKARLTKLLPAEVKVGDILLGQTNQDDKGAQWITATLTLSSSDSKAFEQAMVTLGDASNGAVWEELSIAGDAEHHTLKASGQLALLMVEQAE